MLPTDPRLPLIVLALTASLGLGALPSTAYADQRPATKAPKAKQSTRTTKVVRRIQSWEAWEAFARDVRRRPEKWRGKRIALTAQVRKVSREYINLGFDLTFYAAFVKTNDRIRKLRPIDGDNVYFEADIEGVATFEFSSEIAIVFSAPAIVRLVD